MGHETGGEVKDQVGEKNVCCHDAGVYFTKSTVLTSSIKGSDYWFIINKLQ